jgi:hypothetical protein
MLQSRAGVFSNAAHAQVGFMVEHIGQCLLDDRMIINEEDPAFGWRGGRLL